jgi:hypothetical protein
MNRHRQEKRLRPIGYSRQLGIPVTGRFGLAARSDSGGRSTAGVLPLAGVDRHRETGFGCREQVPGLFGQFPGLRQLLRDLALLSRRRSVNDRSCRCGRMRVAEWEHPAVAMSRTCRDGEASPSKGCRCARVAVPSLLGGLGR